MNAAQCRARTAAYAMMCPAATVVPVLLGSVVLIVVLTWTNVPALHAVLVVAASME
jgi:hypothetical protein